MRQSRYFAKNTRSRLEGHVLDLVYVNMVIKTLFSWKSSITARKHVRTPISSAKQQQIPTG